MKRFISRAVIFVLVALLLVLVAFPVFAQAETWESYRDDPPSTVWGNTTGTAFNSTYYIAYMKGTGFTGATYAYKVGYYDAGANSGTLTATDVSPTLDGTTLRSSYALDTDTGAASGKWHSVVFDTTGDIPDYYEDWEDPPGTWNDGATTVTYKVVEDYFYVEASAIPEFPTVIAMIVAMGLSFGIYYWMRKRYHRQVVTA